MYVRVRISRNNYAALLIYKDLFSVALAGFACSLAFVIQQLHIDHMSNALTRILNSNLS